MQIAAGDKAAFRCVACGHIVGTASAGERDTPIACPVCPGPKAKWEVLADCPTDRLAELGLTAEDVARHMPAGSGGDGGRHVRPEVADRVVTADR